MLPNCIIVLEANTAVLLLESLLRVNESFKNLERSLIEKGQGLVMILRMTLERGNWQSFVLHVLSQVSICLRTGLSGMIGQCTFIPYLYFFKWLSIKQ
jgi:hypothetical protein